MVKKIIVGIIAFLVGIKIPFYCDLIFRNQIQDIFRWTTLDRIEFVGKNFHLFNSYFYHLSFAFALLAFSYVNLNGNLKSITKNFFIFIIVFGISVFLILTIDANSKLIQCTACDNGILKLHWNGINYGLILGVSVIIAIIPSLIIIFKNRKNAIAQHHA